MSAQVKYTDTVFQYFDQNWKEVSKQDKFEYFRIAGRLPDSTWHVRDYYNAGHQLQMVGICLDDSFKVPDGKFYFYHLNGKLKKECSYNKGKPVGLHREYNHKGVLLDSTRFKANGLPFHKSLHWNNKGMLIAYGEYDMEGKGTGYMTGYWDDKSLSYFGKYSEGYLQDSVWTYYHRNGKMSLAETYKTGIVQSYICYDTNGILLNDCDTALHPAEPGYDAGAFLAKNVRMPMEAKEAGLNKAYRVQVIFFVDTDGSIIDVEVENNIYDFFIKEAVRVVKMFPKWQPTKHKNRAILSYYRLPVSFRFD